MSLLERVFYFHQEARLGNFPNARTLADHFEVSVATARRDIGYLRDRLLAPLTFDPKRNGFIYQDDGFRLPFEESPRVVFLLAMLGKLAEEAGLGGLPEVRQLEERLTTLLSADYRKIVDSLFCQWIEVESIDHMIFATIIEAVIKKRLVALEYRPVGGELRQRTVAPLQIVNYQGRWYLYGFCNLRRGNRLFQISRANKAALSSQPIPDDVHFNRNDLIESFGIFQGKPRYQAEILFTAIAAELVRNQRWHKDQKLTAVDNGLLLRVPVSDSREILMKILQYGAMARVISPPELVLQIQKEIQAMAGHYPPEKICQV
jgi:predicted DNA-binding transcriptional regulator YafY